MCNISHLPYSGISSLVTQSIDFQPKPWRWNSRPSLTPLRGIEPFQRVSGGFKFQEGAVSGEQ